MFVLVLLALAGGALAMAFLARSRFHARHRVDPTVPTSAPATWLADPRHPARLHRRLARAGGALTAIVDTDRPATRRARRRRGPVELSPLESSARDLRNHAVAVDQRITRLAVLAPGARRGALAEAAREVAEIEAATARLVDLHSRVRLPDDLVDTPSPAAAATQQADLLSQAHAELARLDDHNGLAGVAATPTPTPTPPPASAGAGRTAPQR